MGLGKTVQTLAFLRAHQGDGAALVVCPTSLVTNWENEARKFTPELNTLVLEGADRAARFKSIADVDVVITSYALLRRDIDTTTRRSTSRHARARRSAAHQESPDAKRRRGESGAGQTATRAHGHPDGKLGARSLGSLSIFSCRAIWAAAQDFRERYEQPITRDSPRRSPPAGAPVASVDPSPAEARGREGFAGQAGAGVGPAN